MNSNTQGQETSEVKVFLDAYSYSLKNRVGAQRNHQDHTRCLTQVISGGDLLLLLGTCFEFGSLLQVINLFVLV